MDSINQSEELLNATIAGDAEIERAYEKRGKQSNLFRNSMRKAMHILCSATCFLKQDVIK